VVFNWDPRKATTNRKKHGIDFHEATTVLNDTLSNTFPDPDHSTPADTRFVTVGTSDRGRVLVVVHTERARVVRHAEPPVESKLFMKKRNRKPSEMRAEYDFANMKGRVRGKYVKRYRAGTNLVLLDPEVYKAFPTSKAVNQALRAVLTITKAISPSAQGRKTG
jgi:uncharacterized DUF497 family protein